MSTCRAEIIASLKQNGADLVGFAGIERFSDGRIAEIFPATKTVIGIAFRVLRGSHRGIEEGTTYYQYTTTGVETLEETVMPMALLRACAVLEDHGFSALPQRRHQTIMAEQNSTNPEVDYTEIYRGLASEKQLDFEQTAVLCGLGELGLPGTLLTDEFGPLQRTCFILTDAEFEETPLVVPHLCDGCGKCIAACPGNAISPSGEIDRWQCAAYYLGANMSQNPFMPPDAFADEPDRLKIIAGEAKLTPERAREIIDQIIFYPPIKQAYVSSICGKACDRACYVHLEEKGVLRNSFHSKFRKREEWRLDTELKIED
jgi:epoxyqueuosine reductase QueG